MIRVLVEAGRSIKNVMEDNMEKTTSNFDKEVLEASDEDLNKILSEAWNKKDGYGYQMEYQLKTLIVSMIKNQRHIDKIENRNKWYTWIIIGLTAISIVGNLREICDVILWLCGKI